ncbi:MAG TPA: OmpH family outer membrane protein, partial [Planctomycetaceae bacterium]|nr:OmpH family outer membrane protein [Planctomycetaceae bacterium]
MKKLAIYSTLSAVLCGASLFLFPPLGGPQTAEAQNSPSQPHMIALIDMAEVFKNYKKFEAMRETLKAEITASEEEMKKEITVLQDLQQRLQKLEESSPSYAATEKELASKAAELEGVRKVKQREFLRKESTIYKAIYMEATEAVSKYADYYKYTLVLRFNRTDLAENDDAKKVIDGMNKQVVYYRP